MNCCGIFTSKLEKYAVSGVEEIISTYSSNIEVMIDTKMRFMVESFTQKEIDNLIETITNEVATSQSAACGCRL